MSFLNKNTLFVPLVIAALTTISFATLAAAEEPAEPGAAGKTGFITITAEDGAVSKPWHTLSGLTADPNDPTRLFAVADHDSPPARIFELDVSNGAAKIVREILLKNASSGNECDEVGIEGVDLEKLDLEGVAAKGKGGFWVASEGNRKKELLNQLLEVNVEGCVLQVVDLPVDITKRLVKKGFEGVALDETENATIVYSALQVPLEEDDDKNVKSDTEYRTRIGAYDVGKKDWTFFLYPLLATGNQTGVSELLHLGDGRFAAIERDSAAGQLAKVKLVTTFDLKDLEGAGVGEEAPTATNKRTAIDLIGLYAKHGRAVDEQIEGLAVTADGNVYAVVDNNEVKGTPLLRLGKASDLFP